jgi:hypothetical protein
LARVNARRTRRQREAAPAPARQPPHAGLAGAALLLVVGLVLWYAGGGAALARLLESGPIAAMTLAGAAFVFVRSLSRSRHRVAARRALADALLSGASAALFLVSAAALANRHLDRSAPATARSAVVDVHPARRGPPQVAVAWRNGSVRIPRDVLPGCPLGAPVRLSVRRGLLGAAWVESANCDG